jgi:hypothetical protein
VGAVQSLADTGREVSQVHSANEVSVEKPAEKPAVDSELHVNCDGYAQSVGAAMAMLALQKHPTPSSFGQRPRTDGPERQLLQRNSPGRVQPQGDTGAAGSHWQTPAASH